MKVRVCIAILCAAGFAAHAQKANDATNALELLQQASRRYADVKSFRIEAVSESNTSTEMSRRWEKRLWTATVAPGNRYRYEVRSPAGGTVRVSDGKTEWIYHIEENAYTRHAAPPEGPAPPQMMNMAALEEFHTFQLSQDLANLAGLYQTAQSQPDETIDVGGRPIACYVIRVGSSGAKAPPKPGSRFEKTIWIAKSDLTIRKIVTHQHMPSMLAPDIFEDEDIVEIFTIVELGEPIADDAFAFTPPATAAAVEQFSNPFKAAPDLKGKPAPQVTFKSADGKETSLASFHGKPVLIDFWATWCLPCVASMPEMAKLHQQTKDKGLVFISIDEDTEAKTAADFLVNKHEPWTNYHDDGDIGKAFHKTGLPFTILIDSQGKVVYSSVGYGDSSLSDLREAIGALGPEYASVKTPIH